jgi:hypothetical protein
MRVDFPYPSYEAIAPVEIPDANLMGVYAPRTFAEVVGAAGRGGARRVRRGRVTPLTEPSGRSCY